MSDEKQPTTEISTQSTEVSKRADLGGEEKSSPATEIAYCPHLDIYHYLRADGKEYLFSTYQLEQAIEGYQRQGDATSAEFMATLTAFARRFPHRVVSFDAQGRLNLRELLEKKVADEEEPAPPLPPVGGSEGGGGT